jgi:glycosyltransferase involved in cell wall biosynthesis
MATSAASTHRMVAKLVEAPKRLYLGILANRMKKYEAGILNKFDSLIPITLEDAEIFRQMGCKIPMHVSPTGLDVKRYKISALPTERHSFFHLGALDWMPNQEAIQWFLAKVWPVVYLKHPEAKFYIAGRNLPYWITELSIPGVIIIGEVASAAHFINSKEIMVVPLLSGSGMRIKIIEGMALGKAIISTSIGAEGINFTSGEDIMIADSPEAFAHAMSELLNGKSLPVKIGKNARRLAERDYDNDRLVKSLIEFYRTQALF